MKDTKIRKKRLVETEVIIYKYNHKKCSTKESKI